MRCWSAAAGRRIDTVQERFEVLQAFNGEAVLDHELASCGNGHPALSFWRGLMPDCCVHERRAGAEEDGDSPHSMSWRRLSIAP
jgi:hypothetical protein